MSSNHPFDGTVLEGKELKYTVLNNADIEKYLTNDEISNLKSELSYYIGIIEEGRLKDNKSKSNSYVVINTDESYIIDIVKIMKNNGHFY